MTFPKHHLYSFLDDDNVVRYSLPNLTTLDPSTTNIIQLSKLAKNFRIYLDIWNNFENRKAFRTKEGKLLRYLFWALKNDKKVDDRLLTAFSGILMHAGASGPMRLMQQYIQHFRPHLPPMYRDVIPVMDFNVHQREELIFHNCRPDIYVWMPFQPKEPKKLLVVYLTKSNTLNMPLPYAHLIFAKLNINVMYIFNRPKKPHDAYIGEFEYTRSIKVIQSIFQKHGFEEIFGIGASLGGYNIFQLAADLNMTRVLNFSGNIFHDKSTKKQMAPGYDHHKILSILSSKNTLDIKLAKAYKDHQFKSQVLRLESDSHGTFTASFLENKLHRLFEWLWHGHTL